MITSPMQGVIQQLRRAVLVPDGAGLTDGQLLTLFIDQRDEAAFEALVRRHGPMIMGVCRRILRNPHDAEDAFQATFLVLVRKAACVVPREMVANWLYGVARTTARRANSLTAKRQTRERQVREMPEPEVVQPGLWQDLQTVLDQELSRLPDKYRVAIVLCDLEGKSHKEAARQLGWPQGTVSGRLVRGRKLLADRLARHSLAVSGGVLAGLLSPHAASASVPSSLVSSTAKAASMLAAGQAAVAGLISVRAAALMKGVVLTMLLNKLKTVTLAGMFAATVGGAGLVYRTQAGEPAQEPPRAAEAQTDKKEPPLNQNAELGSSETSGKNLLSSNPMPRPALVSLDRGQLVVRTLDVIFEPTAVLFHGQPQTSYQKVEILKTKHYFIQMIKVYDVSGKSIPKKELSRLLKKETVALVSTDAEATDPLNLRLFKESTLLFVLPSLPPPPVAPAGGVTYFPATQPAAPAGGATVYGPVPPPLAPAIPAPKADPEVLEMHERNVRVPVAVAPGQSTTLRCLRLFASADKGKTWEMVDTISQDADSFVFRAPKDGLYWLVVQTVGRDGKANPSDLTEGVRPQVKVLINTKTVHSVQFMGNHFTSGDRLVRELCASHQWYARVGDTYTKQRADSDVQALLAYYRQFGFRDVEVTLESQPSDDGREMNVIFHIHEGLRYRPQEP